MLKPRQPAESDALSLVQEEAYRVLRSNLSVVLSDLESPTVLVTSSLEGEGKTATAVNLARSFARSGRRVVLVDLDLRRPDTHRWLGAHNEFGVSDALLGSSSVEQCLQYVDVAASGDIGARPLYLLSAGQPVGNPTELLGSRRTAQLLEALTAQADIVLVDTPPVLLVADTLVIGRMAAGAILVAETRRTPIVAVQRAKDALTRNQTRILGLVLNKFQAKDATDEPFEFGFGYGYPAISSSNGGRGDGPKSGVENRPKR